MIYVIYVSRAFFITAAVCFTQHNAGYCCVISGLIITCWSVFGVHML